MMENTQAINFKKLRNDFPMLKTQSHGQPYAYLNNAATALKPNQVLLAMEDYYKNYGVSIYRGVDEKAYQASLAYDNARSCIAKYLNANKAEEIVFTRGTTSALNLVASSFGELIINEDDEIIVTEMEHHANYIPWQQLALRKKAKLIIAPVNKTGELTEACLKSVLSPKTKLLACAQMTNVMGAKQNLKALAKLMHDIGAFIVVDGAQGIVHEKTDVQALNLDFYAFSAHKIYGPTGVGCLYGKYKLLQVMPPIEFGGEMIDKVNQYETSFRDAPWRFEAGTMMNAEIIGFAKALDYVEHLGIENLSQEAARLCKLASEKLSKLDTIEIYNKGNESSGILSFNLKGIHPHDAASTYDQKGIALRAGHHCAQRCMLWLKQIATLRASFAFYNTEDEVERFIEASKKAGDFLNVLF